MIGLIFRMIQNMLYHWNPLRSPLIPASQCIMAFTRVSFCISDHRLFRLANVSWHLPGYHFIYQITVYLGLPGYHGITPYHTSPFASVCQNITASIPYRRTTHSCYPYWLNALCLCFNYSFLPRSYDLINQLCRVCVLRNISACYLALPGVAKMPGLPIVATCWFR